MFPRVTRALRSATSELRMRSIFSTPFFRTGTARTPARNTFRRFMYGCYPPTYLHACSVARNTHALFIRVSGCAGRSGTDVIYSRPGRSRSRFFLSENWTGSLIACAHACAQSLECFQTFHFLLPSSLAIVLPVTVRIAAIIVQRSLGGQIILRSALKLS